MICQECVHFLAIQQQKGETGLCFLLLSTEGVNQQKNEVVSSYTQRTYANVHVWRKGGLHMQLVAQHAPPSVPSVARQGEWLMGKGLDVYWHCAMPGDQ